MTALAMIIGMIPMALGIGEGAEQNAPLGRAVIGGLLFATVSTLFFVPVVYAGVHRSLRAARARARLDTGRTADRHAHRRPDDVRQTSRFAASTPSRPTRRAASAAQIVRRAMLAAVVLVLLVVGAGAHRVEPHGQRRSARGRARPSKREQYVKVDFAASAAARARRCRCPARCRASFRRRSRRARAATCGAGTRTSAAACRKGELLAEIETPEIDQQLSQAVAARAAGRREPASSRRARVERWEALRKKDAVSQQELDERRSADAQARANLAAADANVERLRQLEAFKRVVAPFAGVITRRNVDVGDLIDAGGGAGRALFLLSQTDPLRIYVNVPQAYAQLVKPGQKVDRHAGRTARAQRSRARWRARAASIDPATRTMQIESHAAEPRRRADAGRLVQVSLPLQASRR